MAAENKPEQENPAKPFWAGMDYIISTLGGTGTEDKSNPNEPTFGIQSKSITLPIDQWRAIEQYFKVLERAILDTWEDAVVLSADLDDMKSLPPDELENYRKADVERAESIMERLDNFVDDDKVEV